MSKDIKFILYLAVTLIGPVCFFYFSKNEPTFANWAYDAQLNHYEQALALSHDPDVIFIGSSRTMNNINTHKLNEWFKEDGMNTQCYNLGINWFGHDIQAHHMERWLQHKKPQVIVLEVPMLFRFYLHPHFKRLASSKEIAYLSLNTPWKAPHIMAYYSPRMLYQFMATKFNFPKQDSLFDRQNLAGFTAVEMNEEQLKKSYDIAHRKIKKGLTKIPQSSAYKNTYYKTAYRPHQVFLKRMISLCKEKDIKLIQLIYPKIALNEAHPLLKSDYESHGELWIPPEELIQKAEYWRDASHLNQTGAEVLSKWVYQQFRDKKVL
ncbi:MAG: hypothetical protein HQL32_11070 [Planctomycetes bacterium]|nr:hypothetical protein [Planctomycetota bacterium]